MTYGRIARKIRHILNLPTHRGRWFDTRAVANAVYQTEWASQEEVASVRQSLRKLADRGDVHRSGFFLAEWRLAGQPEVPPDGPGHSATRTPSFLRNAGCSIFLRSER